MKSLLLIARMVLGMLLYSVVLLLNGFVWVFERVSMGISIAVAFLLDVDTIHEEAEAAMDRFEELDQMYGFSPPAGNRWMETVNGPAPADCLVYDDDLGFIQPVMHRTKAVLVRAWSSTHRRSMISVDCGCTFVAQINEDRTKVALAYTPCPNMKMLAFQVELDADESQEIVDDIEHNRILIANRKIREAATRYDKRYVYVGTSS